MTEFTVFTPTYNRAHTLPRVYECLINQSYTNFIWLIIDDGSTDKTKELVDTWINKGILEIKYIYKPNGGKHTAMELAYKSVTTKYIITLDSDDTLLPNAIETFHFNWKLVEEQELDNEIAEIRAFSKDDITGNPVGGNLSMFLKDDKYIDTTWQEWVLKFRHTHEMTMAQNTIKLNECVDFERYRLYSDKIKYIGERVFWSAIGRKYKTRYIRYIARIYHQDAGESLLRPRIEDKKFFYAHWVVSFYITNENIAYFWYNPLIFIKNILIYSISGFFLNITFIKQIKVITNRLFCNLYIILYPISYLIYLYKKYLKGLN